MIAKKKDILSKLVEDFKKNPTHLTSLNKRGIN
jgi:hypothetical protein